MLTQDCELDWDYKARHEQDPATKEKLAHKAIPNVLLCEVWRAEELRGLQAINGTIWRRIAQNQDERYHVLAPFSAESDLQDEGTEFGLALDFKRVFTVRTEELYFRLQHEAKRRVFLYGLFRQDLATRFACYQVRVALPEAIPAANPIALPVGVAPPAR